MEEALEKAVRAIDPDLVPVGTLLNPDQCPAPLLGWLAWAFSVDFWDSGWPEEEKRAVLRDAIAVHRRKGTVGGVKRALRAAGYGDAEIVERYGWDFHDGANLRDGSIRRHEPDHWAEYRIRLARPITVEQAGQVRAILATVAPARCHLRALEFVTAPHIYNARLSRNGANTRGTV